MTAVTATKMIRPYSANLRPEWVDASREAPLVSGRLRCTSHTSLPSLHASA